MNEAISLISILLIFLAVALDALGRHVSNVVRKENPPPQNAEERRLRRRELNLTVFLYALPLNILLAIFFYILLPESVRIITRSSPILWHFDMVSTLFILFHVVLLGALLYSLAVLWSAIRERRGFIREGKSN